VQEKCLSVYNELISLGVAKESARMILPLSTQTTIYMSGTMRSWIHYIDVRATQETQKEHRDIAKKIKQLFINEFPITSEALGYTNANISSVPVL
jgi:thymidylate synthase (FAD)